MTNIDWSLHAGEVLKKLIAENYTSQQEFAYEFHIEPRTVNRYVNQGINKVSTLQELALHFNIEITEFFK